MNSAFSETSEQLRDLFLSQPARLEPGVLLQAHPLQVADGAEVPLHGVDVLGHPCLVGIFDQLDAQAYDWMLQVLVAFREGMLGGDPVYAQGRQPRLFLLCSFYRPEDHARLRLLSEACSVRALSYQRLPADPIQGQTEWLIRLSYPQPASGDFHRWTEQAPHPLQAYLSRFLAACRRGQPSISVEGTPWPMLLVGPQGPFGALHLDEERLVLVANQAEEGLPIVFNLEHEADRDRAIDRILRERAAAQLGRTLQEA
jgi:hypothetical protein